MKAKLTLFFLLLAQLGFCQFGFVRTNYNNCSFFRELMPKEIKNNIVIQKKNDGLEIVIKIPIENKSKDFIQITLTTLDTIIHKYTVGADANDCFAGALKSNIKAIDENKSLSQKSKDNLEVVIMLSCSANEESMETNDTQQGLFSSFLINGLKGFADLNKDKQVTIDELHKYVYGKTVKAAKNRNGKQHPMTFGDFDKNLAICKVYN